MDYEVWPENVRLVDLFCRLDSQWVFTSNMERTWRQGLDYSRVKAAFELMGITPGEWPELFGWVQIMETAALTVFREQDISGQ